MRFKLLALAGLLACTSASATQQAPRSCPTLESMRLAHVDQNPIQDGSSYIIFTNQKFHTKSDWSLMIQLPHSRDFESARWSGQVLLNQIATFRDGPIKFGTERDGFHWVCQYETYQNGWFFAVTPTFPAPPAVIGFFKNK